MLFHLEQTQNNLQYMKRRALLKQNPLFADLGDYTAEAKYNLFGNVSESVKQNRSSCSWSIQRRMLLQQMGFNQI